MSHYYSKKQDSELRIKKIKSVLFNREIELFTANAVFSPDYIDAGTELLIEESRIPKNKAGTTISVLDLGCAYGAVGIALSLQYPWILVTMSDVNSRAVMLAKKNAMHHELIPSRISKIFESDGFEKFSLDDKFDVILFNPPQSAGRKVCNLMIEGCKKHLKEEGTLQLVARHNKGGSEFKKFMTIIFGNCEEIAKKSGYRIYVSTKSVPTEK